MKKVGRIIVFIIVGIILIITFMFLWDSSRPEETTYEIISPQLGNIKNTATATGNIEPRNETAVKPEIPGTIRSILKEVGDMVYEGEIIATINVIPDEGQMNAAESRLRVANINMEQVSKEYERQKKLFENDVISKNDYEIYEATYRKVQEEKENAEEALEIVSTGTSKKSDRINNTRVRSSSSGIILDIPVKTGNKVIPSNAFNDGTTIALVANMNDLIFRGTMDEAEVGKVQVGMPMIISVGAIAGETFDAVLENIAIKGKKESGSVLYEIRAALKVPKSNLIRANYSANANIILEEVKDVITVPESAVEFSKSGLSFVYILKNNSKKQIFIKRAIEIGLYDGNDIEVISGLNLTDRIRGIKIEKQNK